MFETELQEIQKKLSEGQNTGLRLKQDLGLSDVEHCIISRVQGTPIPIYYVWYDSYSTIPLNRNIIERSPIISRLRLAPELDRDVVMYNYIDIEDFNDSIRDGFFITIDLAGRKLVRDVLR